MSPKEKEIPDWEAVTARSLAYICLQQSDVKDSTLAKQAKFLKGLGLTTEDAAGILGTTASSLYELFRLERKKKGGKRARKAKNGKAAAQS
jgi:hypothetical protein